ncbi:hypothetical protein SESBI_26418 [Sesbania bispinosa]|nr:hypothetical protein SESBI_26418 [Sesbania bispinosa]
MAGTQPSSLRRVRRRQEPPNQDAGSANSAGRGNPRRRMGSPVIVNISSSHSGTRLISTESVGPDYECTLSHSEGEETSGTQVEKKSVEKSLKLLTGIVLNKTPVSGEADYTPVSGSKKTSPKALPDKLRAPDRDQRRRRRSHTPDLREITKKLFISHGSRNTPPRVLHTEASPSGFCIRPPVNEETFCSGPSPKVVIQNCALLSCFTITLNTKVVP